MSLRGSRRSAAPALLSGIATALVALSGCGGDDPAPVSAEEEGRPPISPLARIAVGGEVDHTDPLFARGDTDRMVSRQIYDPLVARVSPPFGGSGARFGPARPLGADDNGDWRLELRPGARFHDGTAINFEAVQANVERWVRTGVLEEILPEFVAVDAPLPGQIRFQLSAPVPDLPAALGDPRLGLVAPAALGARRGGEVPDGEGGSGAYEPSFAGRRRMVLAAAANWWGSGVGLGPGVRQLQVLAVGSEQRRAELLVDGLAHVATGLDQSTLDELRRDPLLVSPNENPGGLAISAAVRGLHRSGAQPLSELWLTTLRAGATS